MSSLTIEQILAMRPAVATEPPQWWDGGRQIAFVSGLSGETELWSVARDGGAPVRLTAGMGGVRFLGARLPRVSPDGRWIAFMSERSGSAEVWLWPTDGGPIQQLTRLGGNLNALSWSPDSRALAVSSSRHGAFDIYRVEVPGGETMRLTSSPQYEVYPTFTPDGKSLVFVRMDDRWVDHDIVRIPAQGGEERLILQDTGMFDYHFGRTFGYPLISPDGQTVLFRSYRSGWLNYWQVSIAGGEATPLCAEDADQSEAVWSPDGKSVAYCANRNGTIALHVASVGGRASRPLVAPELGFCALPQWSPDGMQIAYLYQTPTAPQDLWVVSPADGSQRQLTNSALGGATQRLVMPEKVKYQSFDGLPIHAYLYKPPALAPGQKVPGLLWIHGGPTAQWSDVFYNYMQYFALQGYAVLAPNIRGSSGYGKPFEDLNNGDWGHDDLQDVLAGKRYLASLGYVDPARMGITGTSYGGCMSMSAICNAPGEFQAAIPMAGYADWEAMYREQELRHVKLLEFEFGPIETHAHIYRKCSPIHNVKRATTPALVIHGEGGLPRSSASLDFVRALEKEYKTVEYKVYLHEGYYVLGLANTRQMWLDIQSFLERYV